MQSAVPATDRAARFREIAVLRLETGVASTLQTALLRGKGAIVTRDPRIGNDPGVSFAPVPS
jgi:hypothetical protein